MNTTVQIDLAMLEHAWTGLVVPLSTGVLWRTQAGGTACAHPEVEGIFIPLAGDLAEEESFEDLQSRWMEAKDSWRYYADKVSPLFAVTADTVHLRALHETEWALAQLPSPHRLRYWGEAWIPVIVAEDPRENAWYMHPHLEAVKDRLAFLTYPNSD